MKWNFLLGVLIVYRLLNHIHELVSKEENQMLKYKNFGRKSLTELVEKLSSMGLHFGMDTSKILAEEG